MDVRHLHLYELAGGAWHEWTRREDLDASHRTDRHFVLDPDTGWLAFGDGERGQVPADGSLLLASGRTTQARRQRGYSGTPIDASALPKDPLQTSADRARPAEGEWPRPGDPAGGRTCGKSLISARHLS